MKALVREETRKVQLNEAQMGKIGLVPNCNSTKYRKFKGGGG